MGEKEERIKSAKKPKEDILDIVKQFIDYFEEVDRSKQDDYSGKCS